MKSLLGLTDGFRLVGWVATAFSGCLIASQSLSAADQPSAGTESKIAWEKPRVPEELPESFREVHEKLAADLKPETNAAAYWLQTIGVDAIDPGLEDATLALMGIKAFPADAPRFLTLELYVESLKRFEPEFIEAEALDVQAELLEGGERLWKPDELPRALEYLEKNKAALDDIAKAARLPNYYLPLLSVDVPPRLISGSFSVERRLPFIVRVFACRALLRAQNGQMAGAIDDLMTGHRMALLLAKGSPFDVSYAKAYIMDAITCRTAMVLLASGKLSGAEAANYRQRLEELGTLPGPDRAADLGERAIISQEIELLRSDEESVLGFFESSNEEEVQKLQQDLLPELDWKLAHQEADALQDRTVAAFRIKDREQQLKEFLALYELYQAWDESADEKIKLFSKDFAKNKEAASRWIGESIAMSIRPIYVQRRGSDDRYLARRDLVRVGLALVEFQREHKQFPDSLSELVPKLLAEIPLDAQSDLPFVYQRHEGGFATLTALGANRQDDAGQKYSDDVTVEIR